MPAKLRTIESPGRRAAVNRRGRGAGGRQAPEQAADGQSRTEAILDALGRAIVRGDYPVGTTLPTEQELAGQFDAGRNAVREAVRVLVGRGFVKTERRAGSTIQPATEWNLIDPQVLGWLLVNPEHRDRALGELTALRSVIEPEIAALAARNATTTQTLRLFEAFERMEAQATDRSGAIQADIAFHSRLAEASHNGLFLSIMRCFEVLLRANFEMVMAVDGRYIRNLAEHRIVAEAVMKHDAAGARCAMQKLLENNAEDLSQLLPAT